MISDFEFRISDFRFGGTRGWVVVVCVLAWLMPFALAQEPKATISFPMDGSVCRATIPFFGSARVVGGKNSDFKEWRLEYGEGREPVKWTRLAGRTTPINKDPWVAKEVVWNPNTGAPGNLFDWNTGLVGYAYGEWQRNLNGVYSVRLVAELKNGKTAEKQIVLLIGEALLLINGATAVSVDGLCRYSVLPFTHEGQNALVIAAIRYQPPGETGAGAFPTSEAGVQAQRAYELVPRDKILRSPIYRIYPSAFGTDPPSLIQIDLPSPPADSSELSRVCIHSYSPTQKKWLPMKTEWAGKTASARVSYLVAPEALFALMTVSETPDSPTVAWEGESALSGQWVGTGEPGAKLRIRGGQETKDCFIEEDGSFQCPFVLNPMVSSYEFTVVRLNGEVSKPTRAPISADVVVPSKQAVVKILGNAELSDHDSVCVECEDPAIASTDRKKSCMALLVQRQNLEMLSIVELKRPTQESRNFIGTVELGAGIHAIPPNKLKHGETVLARLANGSELRLVYKDTSPPLIRQLESLTHRALLWSNPDDPSTPQLTALNAQSGVQIERIGGGLKLSGTRPNTTRMVRWPINGFSTTASPVLSFDYRCSDPGPWQLLLRCQNRTFALPLGSVKPHFPVLMPSPPLVADGKWHSFEINLAQGGGTKLDQVEQVLMGAWVDDPVVFLEAIPAFRTAGGNVIHLRNLWIGKPSAELSAIMQWEAVDPSGVRKSEWWVDEDSCSSLPPEGAIKGEADNPSLTLNQKANVQFGLPRAGRWYFHVRAQDTAGNRGAPVTYALRVTPSAAERRTMMVSSETGKESESVVWQQPDGKFSLKLTGLNGAFDPSKTVLMIDQVAYPAHKCVWEPVTETMTIDKTAFASQAPLGFDGETLALEVTLCDANGRKLECRPRFSVKIQSPFARQEDGGSIGITLRDPKDTGKWYARWVNPTPPWAALFPGVVNNTLIFSQPIPLERIKKGEQPVLWAHPLCLKPTESVTVVWRETWQSPETMLLDAKEAAILQDTGKPGYRTAYWTWRQDGTEAFSAATVRVVGLSADNQFGIATVSLPQLADLLNRQKAGSRLRIDAWLHPLHARALHVSVTGKRRLSYAYDDSPRWVATKDNDARLQAKDDWTRASILIEAPSRYAEQGGCLVEGQSYW